MSKASTWAIVLVKTLADAKLRLAPMLPADIRQMLVLAMLADVLDVLAGVASIGPVLVVTPDAEVADAAERKRSLVLREDRARGLNAAAHIGLAHGSKYGASRMLVLPADIPCVRPRELVRLIEALAMSERPRVALAPSNDGDGTNALAIAPPGAFEPNFGPGSFVRHVAQAVAQRLDYQVLQLPGLGADVDEPRDVLHLIEQLGPTRRYDFLKPHVAHFANQPNHTEPRP